MCNNKIILFILSLVISNCSIHGQIPWIEQSYRDSHYPADTYYVGFYSQINDKNNLGDCITKTVTAAQSLLANAIQSEVSSMSSTVMTSIDTMEGYSETEAFQSEFSAAASAHLVNVHIEHYYDKPTNTVYAIAYTKKDDLSNFCETKLESNLVALEGKITNIVDLINGGYKQDARKILDEAVELQLASPVYLAQLISVGLSDASTSDYARKLEDYAGKLAKLKSDLKHGTVINLIVEQEYPFGIRFDLGGKCEGILSQHDCSFSGDDADFLITLDCKTRTSSETDGMWFAFNDIDVTLMRLRDNKVIYEDSFSVKGGGGTEERAHRKAIEESSKTICNKIIPFLKE